MIAGFSGGILSFYISSRGVDAQELRQSEKVVKAQEFILLNEQGDAAGVFGFDKNGDPEITLFDERGHVFWSTELRMRTLSR